MGPFATVANQANVCANVCQLISKEKLTAFSSIQIDPRLSHRYELGHFEHANRMPIYEYA